MIYFIGDVYLPHNINDYHIHKLFQPDDIIVANLECVIQVGEYSRSDKSSLLFTSSEAINEFTEKLGGEWIFCLANNHAHDGCEESLLHTVRALLSEGYRVFGPTIGGSSDSILVRDGSSEIRLIAATTSHPEVMSICDEGVFNEIYSIKFADRLRSFKEERKILVLHWGREYLSLPSYDRRLISKSFIEMGVEGIISHHPHMIQGVEWILDGYIFYSLGNFFFPEFYYRNHFLHEWEIPNNCSVGVCLSQDGKIDVVGFELKGSELITSLESVSSFRTLSDLFLLDRKKYHLRFCDSESEMLSKRKSLRHMFRSYFPKHREYRRFGVIINRLKREYRKLK